MDKTEAVYNDMADSVRRLMNARPTIKKMLGGGEIAQVEEIENAVCNMLDLKAGIDYFQVYGESEELKGVIWGISSRFQVGKSWETFTIRLERESGVMTEYEKRKIAIERNGEYPYLTIQGYVTDDGKEELTSLAIARTKDIFECIDSGYRTLQHTRHDKCGQSSFYVVKWEDMVRLGYPIVIYSNGAIRVYKGDEPQ